MSEPYVGYNALVYYIQKQKKMSYRGFLEHHQDLIMSSLSVNSKWKIIDRTWAQKFLREAEVHLDKEKLVTLKMKVDAERAKDGLQTYWKSIIEQHERASVLNNLKEFAYKIISLESPDLVPDEFDPNSCLCVICQGEILPQPLEPITIFACGHLLHLNCVERDHLFNAHCPYCRSPDDSSGSSGGSDDDGDGIGSGSGVGTDPIFLSILETTIMTLLPGLASIPTPIFL